MDEKDFVNLKVLKGWRVFGSVALQDFIFDPLFIIFLGDKLTVDIFCIFLMTVMYHLQEVGLLNKVYLKLLLWII